MRKRTYEEQERELEYIHSEAVRLVKLFATSEPGSLADKKARTASRKLLALLSNRERQDRCYYCYSRKKELGVETVTGLTQCIDCAGDAYVEHLRRSRRIRERLNEWGFL